MCHAVELIYHQVVKYIIVLFIQIFTSHFLRKYVIRLYKCVTDGTSMFAALFKCVILLYRNVPLCCRLMVAVGITFAATVAFSAIISVIIYYTTDFFDKMHRGITFIPFNFLKSHEIIDKGLT